MNLQLIGTLLCFIFGSTCSLIDLQLNVGDKVFLNNKHFTLKAVGARKMLALWLEPFERLVTKQYELRALPFISSISCQHAAALGNRYNEEQC